MFGSPQNVWPLNELYLRSGANAGQIMDFSGPNDLCLDYINNRYAKALVPIQNPIASAHPTDILTRNASGAYDTIPPNGIPRNNLGSQGVPGSIKNLILYSKDFTNAIWDNAGTTISPNSGVGITGANDLTKLTILGGNYFREAITVAENTVYTFSFFALRGTSSSPSYSIYDLSNSNEIIVPTNYSNQINSTVLTKIIISFTTPPGCFLAGCYPSRNSGDGTIFIDNAQLEIGSFATPPIITAGTTVTHPGQQSIISGLTLNTGIEFCHLIDIKDPGSDFVRAIQFDDGTNGNRINVACNAGNMMLDVYSGGVQQASLNLGPWVEGLQAITGSVGAGFAQGHIAGGAVIAPAAPVLFPVVNQMVDSGTGFDVLDNAYTRSKETYVKTGVLPNAASAAKMEALGVARLAALA